VILLSPSRILRKGYEIRRFHIHTNKSINEVGNSKSGSLYLEVQSLIAIAERCGWNALSKAGRCDFHIFRRSTKPCGVKCEDNTNGKMAMSKARANPRLHSLLNVLRSCSGLSAADLWLPWRRKEWKFLAVLCALHKAGEPSVSIRRSCACVVGLTLGGMLARICWTFLWVPTWGPPRYHTNVVMLQS
jgi:hypothetical protein